MLSTPVIMLPSLNNVVVVVVVKQERWVSVIVSTPNMTNRSEQRDRRSIILHCSTVPVASVRHFIACVAGKTSKKNGEGSR